MPRLAESIGKKIKGDFFMITPAQPINFAKHQVLKLDDAMRKFAIFQYEL